MWLPDSGSIISGDVGCIGEGMRGSWGGEVGRRSQESVDSIGEAG